ncbi:MAG: thiamine phosphate synthase [Dehalococcoidia bacterium]
MIDANLNRCSEGLRVMEDVARFVLNDTDLSQRLRALRHDLAQQAVAIRTGLLSGRDSVGDVGRPIPTLSPPADRQTISGTVPRTGLAEVVTANARRAEEALRVMEELARLPELSTVLNPAGFASARFDLYALEKELTSRVSRRDKMDRMQGLYAILDRQFLAGRDELAVAGQIIAGGARVIQLRDKSRFRPDGKGDILPIAQELGALCRQAGVLFIVNDYVDLATAVNADGLHIGQDDLPLHIVRRQLSIETIVGCSVRTLDQARTALDEGADYIAVGSIFPTTTKTGATVVGLDTLREIRGAASVPVVAIGGIDRNNIREVVAAGADSIAVISAALGQEDVCGAVQALVAAMGSVEDTCQNH